MGISQSQYKQIMKAYDIRRQESHQLYLERKEQLYQHHPRLKALDEAIATTTMSTTRQIVENPSKKEALSQQLSLKLQALKDEKADLLKSNGYRSDYLTQTHHCSDCKDTGYIGNEKCHCLKQAIINAAYAQSNLGVVLERENFDTFSLNYYSRNKGEHQEKSPYEIAERNYNYCKHFVAHFDTDTENLILHGQAGLGKTFLCNAIAKNLLDSGKTVVYQTAFSLFRLLENYRFRQEESETTLEDIDTLYQCDLLIIDDLGTELTNAFTTSELFNLLNTRMIHQKSVVISTNLAPSRWVDQYSDRIVSRLLGNYIPLGFIGEDIRLKRFHA